MTDYFEGRSLGSPYFLVGMGRPARALRKNEELEDALLDRLGQIEDPVVGEEFVQIGTNVPHGGRIRRAEVDD